MSSRFVTHPLSNGLKIVMEIMPGVSSAAAGMLVRTGARDENVEQAGVSHFLEHMCFKGTPRLNCRELSLAFDNIGGHPNAFTSQERTFYHGQSRTADIATQIQLLAEMMQSTLPQDEFTREQKVVLEEIAMSNDRIEHVTFDTILEKVFEGHPLHWPVLGYGRTVGALSRDQMHAYLRARYVPENMMLLVAGAVDPAEVIRLTERHCGNWQPTGFQRRRTTPVIRTGSTTKTMDRFQQQVLAYCYPAPSGGSEELETAQAVAAILGGDNSRFFWEIVQAGLCPMAGTWHLDYSDCGLMIMFGQTHPDRVEDVAEAFEAQARRICREEVSEAELDRVKNKRRTGLAVEGESPYHRLVQLVDDVDYRGAPQSVEERLAAVEAVSVKSIRDYLTKYPIDGKGYVVSVGPRDWPPGNSSN